MSWPRPCGPWRSPARWTGTATAGSGCTGDVCGDVPVADHDDTLAGEVELTIGEIGVGVVPIDELGGGMAAGQILAGDSEVAIGGGAKQPLSPVPDGVDPGE